MTMRNSPDIMKSVADVNVILPLILAQHPHRDVASAWWSDQADQSVVFTLPVRMAILRLLTNRKLMGDGVLKPEDAWMTVNELIADARAILRTDSPPGLDLLWLSFVRGRDSTPNLWTDAWLAAFAEAEGYEMTTFDRGFRQFNLSRLKLLGD